MPREIQLTDNTNTHFTPEDYFLAIRALNKLISNETEAMNRAISSAGADAPYVASLFTESDVAAIKTPFETKIQGYQDKINELSNTLIGKMTRR